MNHNAFSLIMRLPNLIYEDLSWNDDEFKLLENEIIKIENGFRSEISQNLFGSTTPYKIDLIKNYFHSIAGIYHNYLAVVFDSEEINSIKLVDTFKIFIQNIIDVICLECIKYNIDASSIVDENDLSRGILNLEIFYEAKRNIIVESSMAETKLKSSFTSTEAFEFFKHLNSVFYNKKSDLSKYSCIYVMMTKDKFLDNDLKPDDFKKLIGKTPFNIKISHYLKSLHSLPAKAIRAYEEEKIKFFNSLENQ